MGSFLRIHREAAEVLGITIDEVRDFVHAAIAEHERLLLTEASTVRKDAPESAVTLVKTAGAPAVCVKEFRKRRWTHALRDFFRTTKAERSFVNGWTLYRNAIGAPRPLALLETRRRVLIESEHLIMEVIPHAREFDRFALNRIKRGWSAKEKKRFIRAFARFIGSLHARGFFHSDLKTCNILVSKGADYRFYLVDYDDLIHSQRITGRQRIRNLVQIFLSTPIEFGASDRMRFLRAYARQAGLSGPERRAIAPAVIREASGRRILYVGFDGDIEEAWER
jgi:tRNA A-37 threonylcarbamoyl transferase component Bud32